MRFPILTPDMPLIELRREVRYTLAVMRHRPWSSVHVPTFEALLKEVSQHESEQSSLLDKLEDAAAGVDEADLHLDIFLEATAVDARIAVDKDTKAPLWRSLFGTYRPSELQRFKLGEELEQVRNWPELLRAAPTPALRDRAADCAKIIKTADEAVKAQSTARSAQQVFKTSKLVPLVAKLNAERSGLAGDAEKQSFDGKIRAEAAQGLFRLSPRPRPRPETLASVQAELAANEKEHTRLLAALTTLQGPDEQAERRRADQAALVALQASRAEADQKIAELEKRLQN